MISCSGGARGAYLIYISMASRLVEGASDGWHATEGLGRQAVVTTRDWQAGL